MPLHRELTLTISTGAEDPNRFFTKYRTQSTMGGLRVAFDITKTSKTAANIAKLSIYNLSPENRARFSILPAHVHLQGAYRGENTTLYKGDLTSAKTDKKSVNWITTLQCGTGVNVMHGARSSFTVGKGGTHLEQVQRLLADAGIKLPTTVDGMKEFLSGKATPSGKTLHGPSIREAGKLLGQGGYRLSIQDDQVVIVDENKKRFANATVISPDTGLIGSPTMNTPDKKGKKPVLSFRCFIKPDLKIGNFVQMYSRDIQGAFQIKKHVMVGDLRSKPYYSQVEAISL